MADLFLIIFLLQTIVLNGLFTNISSSEASLFTPEESSVVASVVCQQGELTRIFIIIAVLQRDHNKIDLGKCNSIAEPVPSARRESRIILAFANLIAPRVFSVILSCYLYLGTYLWVLRVTEFLNDRDNQSLGNRKTLTSALAIPLHQQV